MLLPTLLNCSYQQASPEQPTTLLEVEGLHSWRALESSLYG